MSSDPLPISVPGRDEPQGVGGWLLLLCIGLTIGMPLATAINVVSGLSQGLPLVGRVPDWGLYLYLDTLLSGALAVVNFIAGLRLWREVPGADRLAKVALALNLVYHFVSLAIVAISQLPPEVKDAIYKELQKGLPRAALGTFIWLMYLYGSKRVANTYREPFEEKTVGA